jgi:phage-related protein
MKNTAMLRLSEWVSGAREKALEFITKIIDGVRSRISEVVSAVISLKDRALGALTGWASSAYNRGVEFVNSIASGIRNAIGGLRSAVDEAAGVAAGAWPQSPPKWGPLSNIMDYGGNIMTSIASGITPAPLASAMRQALIPTQQQLTSGGGTAGTTAGGGTTSINFAPTINAAPGTDIAAIESVLRDQLEILLERIDRDKNRVSYG